MKALALIATLLATTTVAHADGFVCETEAGDLKVAVYNQVQPELGTRSAAHMIVSNPNVQLGRKTIAKFTAAKGTLTSRHMTYTADVDLRFTDSSRKGELIMGTKLGELSQIVLEIDYSYSSVRLAEGETTTAEISLEKRNGDVLVADMVCSRYLKGE